MEAWQEATKKEARLDKPKHRVRTMLGRHRSLPGIAKAGHAAQADRGKAERAAINTPVQGSAADVVMAAMQRVHHDPRLQELDWHILLQVHDEVLLNATSHSFCCTSCRLV